MSKAIAATAARLGGTPVIKNWLLDEEFLEKLKELYGPDYDWAVNTMSHESSGIANAHNTGTPDNPENSRGLMQINWDFWGTEPNFREEFKDLIKSEEDLFDPIINAMAGKYILATEGKSPWAGTREKVEAALAQAEYPGTMDARPREAGTSDYWTERAAEMQQRREDLYKGQEQEVETKITKEEGQPTKEVTTVKGVLSDAFDPERWITPDVTPEVQQTSLLDDARLAGITGPEMDLLAGNIPRAEVWPPEDSPYRPTDALHGDITRGNILRAAGMPQEGPIPPGYAHGFAPGIAAPEEEGFRPPPSRYFDPRMGVGLGNIGGVDPRMGVSPTGSGDIPTEQRGFFERQSDRAVDTLQGIGRDIAAYPGNVLERFAETTGIREGWKPRIDEVRKITDYMGITEDPLIFEDIKAGSEGKRWFENQALGQFLKRAFTYLFREEKPGQLKFFNEILGLVPEFNSWVINQALPEGTTIELPLTREKLKDLPDWTVADLVNATGRGLKKFWNIDPGFLGTELRDVPELLEENILLPRERAAREYQKSLEAGQYPSQDYTAVDGGQPSLMGDLQREILPQIESLGGDTFDEFKTWAGGVGADIGEAVGDVYTRVREDPSGAFEDFTGAVGTGYTAAKDLVGAGLDFIGRDEEAAVEAPAVQAPSTVTIKDKGLTASNFVTSARGGTKGVTDGAVDVQGRPIYTTADPQVELDLDIEKEFLDINSTANWLTGLARLIGASDPGPDYRRQRTEQLRLTYEMQRDLLGIGVGTVEIYKLDADGDILPNQMPIHWSKDTRVPTGYTTRKPESTQQSRASNAMKKELIASLKKGETPIMAAGKAFNKYRMRISAGGGLAGFGMDDAVVYREILSLIRDFGDMNNIPEWKNITLQELAPNLQRMPGS